MEQQQQPLGELVIADSRFLGFCYHPVRSQNEAEKWQAQLKRQHPSAAHVPLVWRLREGGGIEAETKEGWDEDGEPVGSVGPVILNELRLTMQKIFHPGAGVNNNNETNNNNNTIVGVAVVVVRYFGSQLLGVTCGRLSGCYQSIVRQTLHRSFAPASSPQELELLDTGGNVYGLAAGDCELILDVVPDSLDQSNNDDDLDDEKEANKSESSHVNIFRLVDKIEKELNFDGFRGASGEVLPRLQNLQADCTDNIIPIYRYPGNYSGNEWDTYPWSPTSLRIKEAVEEALRPLWQQTIINHCVTNYYQKASDFIAHHSDKDLDLNRSGVIVSVSLGDERTLELKRRPKFGPADTTRIALPHGSMFVLGPVTNQQFSHSILPKTEQKEEEKGTQSKSPFRRISLTLREVKTFRDLTTGQLVGQGVANGDSRADNDTSDGGNSYSTRSAVKKLRQRYLAENAICAGVGGGMGAAMAAWFSFASRSKTKAKSHSQQQQSVLVVALTGLLSSVASLYVHRHWSDRRYQHRQEQAAREFFSKQSLSGTKY